MGTTNRVIILGSGFSKSFSAKMPTLKDLTERLYKCEDPIYDNLISFAGELYEKSNFHPDFNNLENIATLIFSRKIFRDFEEEMDFEKLKFELIKFIYNEINHQKIEPSKEDTLYKFLLNMSRKKNSGDPENIILTLNYDLIIEDILNEKEKDPANEGIDLRYGLRFEKYNLPEETKKRNNYERELEMLKLHGSFNWFRAKGSATNDIRDIYLLDSSESMYSIHETDIPTYIPMANVKGLFLNGTLYNTLWAKAIDKLNKCREIIFIGYGFPYTDLNNLSIFLDYKEKIRYINVEERDESNKLRRLKSIFGEDLVLNMDAKKFIEKYL